MNTVHQHNKLGRPTSAPTPAAAVASPSPVVKAGCSIPAPIAAVAIVSSLLSCCRDWVTYSCSYRCCCRRPHLSCWRSIASNSWPYPCCYRPSPFLSCCRNRVTISWSYSYCCLRTPPFMPVVETGRPTPAPTLTSLIKGGRMKKGGSAHFPKINKRRGRNKRGSANFLVKPTDLRGEMPKWRKE